MSPRGIPKSGKARHNDPGQGALKVLRQLADEGGAVTAAGLGKGRIPAGYFDVATSTVLRCDKQGWIRRVTNGRQTMSVVLTRKGRDHLREYGGLTVESFDAAVSDIRDQAPTRIGWGSSPAAQAKREIAVNERIARAWETLTEGKAVDVRRLIDFVELGREILNGA